MLVQRRCWRDGALEIVGYKIRLTLNLICGREGVGGRVMVGIGRVCQVWFFRLLGGGMMQVDF